MLVANSFDLWRKDAFFSAAEEVQESADVMESVYRTWVRERREGLSSEDSEELGRELQTALGTAKWQLEEFERAVRLSHGNRCEDNTTARHSQFVAAMADQISHVENTLRESRTEEGKQPLRWVNLDEKECDDLAAFLSAPPGTSQSKKDEYVELGPSMNNPQQDQSEMKDANLEIDVSHEQDMPACKKAVKDVTVDKNAKYVIDLEANDIPGTQDDWNSQNERLNGTRRTWSSPNFGSWKIVIADEDEQRKTMGLSTESTPKGKGSPCNFWKQKCGERIHSKGRLQSYIVLRGINWFNQLFGRSGGFQRQLQGPQYLQFSRSLQLVLAFMITIFLIVPFLVYAT